MTARHGPGPRRSGSIDSYLRETRAIAGVALLALVAGVVSDALGGWLVPAAGYGVPGHAAHLVLEGGTSIQASDLARLDVTVVKGGTLLSIPVQSASG